jgi:tetratricopeptide (TPR) repeat protein
MRSALNVSLADIEVARSLRERPTNPNAFDLVLQARAVSSLPITKDTSSQSLALFEQALQRDPNSVLALSGAAQAVLNEFSYDILPFDVAIDRARQYIERARALQPNAEVVLATQVILLDWQQGELDYQRVRHDLEAAATRLIEYYPNNPTGYFELGVLRRNQGRYDDAAVLFAKTIQLSPRAPFIKNFYWNMAFCNIYAGRDREGLQWIDRVLTVPGSLPSGRERMLLVIRSVAAFRTGDTNTAKRLAEELNDKFPFDTWRQHNPDDPDSDTNRAQVESVQRVLKAAGNRDHLDPNADFGVAPDNGLHEYLQGKTPTIAPGVTTVDTERLAGMLENDKPTVIDTMDYSWYRSVPGAVGLQFRGNTHGTFDDVVQKRLELKLRELTGGNLAKPIVAMSFNVSYFDGYNLALRLRHAGYTNVYWYRGGREAWEVAGKPEDVVRPADW